MRAELEQLFMLIVFCDLIGHSIPAPLLLRAALTLHPAWRAALEARGAEGDGSDGFGKGRNIGGGENLWLDPDIWGAQIQDKSTLKQRPAAPSRESDIFMTDPLAPNRL
jgi:hypothetical protein